MLMGRSRFPSVGSRKRGTGRKAPIVAVFDLTKTIHDSRDTGGESSHVWLWRKSSPLRMAPRLVGGTARKPPGTARIVSMRSRIPLSLAAVGLCLAVVILAVGNAYQIKFAVSTPRRIHATMGTILVC